MRDILELSVRFLDCQISVETAEVPANNIIQEDLKPETTFIICHWEPKDKSNTIPVDFKYQNAKLLSIAILKESLTNT